ncbi:MAG: guanylate kinase [Actinobacteria bacterium 13_1_40CM_2_65_8]|nr:MAG: guanylate kinase [Actinobacteria bacterium 13_1_40CM_2_65_8]
MSSSKPGLLIVISGPSGVGKDTVIKRVLELDPNLRYSVSYTTRAPRPGEVDGVNYHFVSREEFERLIREGAFLEFATYDANLYGTPIAELDKVRADGHDIVLKIDVQGAEQVRKRAPDALRIFLAPPSMDELVRRRTERHSESARDQAARQIIAKDEMALAPHFDHVVVNDDLERAVQEVLAIIRRARERHT